MKVCVVGAGAWGTTVAHVLADNGHDVSLWCRESEVVRSINTNGCNEQFLPNILLSKKITPTNALSQGLKDAEWIFMAVPVQHFRSVLQDLKPYYHKNQKWVLLSKGIENETLLLPRSKQNCTVFFAASIPPLLWPNKTSILFLRAQRRLPSITTARCRIIEKYSPFELLFFGLIQKWCF